MIILMMVPDMLNDEAADAELDALCDHVEKRIRSGAEMRRLMQAMLEVMLAQLEEDGHAEILH